jgi:formylglycine-generating enzyme required for sulfatase activity
MVVVPAGSFLMGSRLSEDEGPPHEVAITNAFAVSKFELTFDEWDTCVEYGDCDRSSDVGWGRGSRPVINVSWEDAQAYVKWLSRITGKGYRLLSEAEYEYAARAGTETKYPWGDEIRRNGQVMANCNGCGSYWDNKQTAPVGSFPPNAFGLYDVVGNVSVWTEDCYEVSYAGAPADGSAWISRRNCTRRIVRGGSWGDVPNNIRSATRNWSAAPSRSFDLGFRVARTLAGTDAATVPSGR